MVRKLLIDPINNRKKYHNAGFSLIELIIVIAIITVVTSSALIGFNAVRSGDASKTSKSIAGELLSLRQNTLSMKGTWSIELINKSGKYVLYTYHDNNLVSKKDYGSRIEISYHETGLTNSKLDGDQKLLITFSTGSGIVKDVKLVKDVDDIMKQSKVEDGINLVNGSAQNFIISVNGKHKTNCSDVDIAYETGRVIN